jgi:type I restriction enzyme S subunit
LQNTSSYIETGWRWPADTIRPLSTALSRKSADVDREKTPADAIRLVTLHFDGEMELRNESAGESFKGRLYFADPGDVIYSKIDVRNGAIGIIPEDLGRVCVSSEYPVYAVDPQIAVARFVKLLFRTAAFRRKINSMISGASGRKRVQPSDLETVEVPLPPLPVQRKIVAAWEEARRAAAATAAKIERLERDIEARFLADLGLKATEKATLPKAFAVWWRDLERWGVVPNQLTTTGVDISRCKYAVVVGRDCLAEVKHGCSASPSPMPTTLEVLKISAATRGYFRPEERKYAFDVARYRQEFGLRSGDVLMCRTNGTLGLVGMSALVEADMPNLIFPDKLIRVRCKANILPAYLWKLVQMQFARSQIESAARTAVGNYAIGSDDIWALRLPLPPLPVQQAVMKPVEAGRAEIAALKADAQARADAVKADVEAMILGTKPVE